MSNPTALISKLLRILESKNYLKKIELTLNFPDEPPIFRYRASVGENEEIYTGGASFLSKENALLKCLGESVERLSSNFYIQRNLILGNYINLKKKFNILDPCLYLTDKSSRQKVFGWYWGVDFLTEKQCLIPAQLLFFSKYIRINEPELTHRVSTGSAGWTDLQTALLKSLYEIIERDAFMTNYLNKIPSPMIDLKTLRIPEVDLAYKKATRYNLDLCLFDITNDLQIPSYMSVLIDRTGIGPAVVIGLKACLNKKEAITGCMEDAFYLRPWLRAQTANYKARKKGTKEIKTVKDRALYWMGLEKIKELNFLMNQKPQKIKFSETNLSSKKQLAYIKKSLQYGGFEAFYSDITLTGLEMDYFITRAVIPKLQPLYFYEKKPQLRIERIKKVSKFFGQKKVSLNKIPHPML